jgi:signal transduction histidine kinase
MMTEQTRAERMAEFRTIHLFEHLRPDQLEWIADHGETVCVAAGDYVYRQGEAADYFYVILSGEMQVTQDNNGAVTLLAVHQAGNFSGEVPLLSGTPYIASGRATQDTRLLRFDSQAFRDMFGVCPVIVSKLFGALQQRIQRTEAMARQNEKMSALGVLSAGIAHELNNPAAAVARATDGLRDALIHIRDSTRDLSRALDEDAFAALEAAQRTAADHLRSSIQPDALTLADREDELSDWMSDHDADDAIDHARMLALAGIDADALDQLYDVLGDDALLDALNYLGTSLNALDALTVIEQGTKRMSDLVKSIKSYTHMDQAPLQSLDVHAGLEDTLRIMAYKLRHANIRVERQYASDIPPIMMYGAELNQVWTNLIDNAIDAMGERGTLTLRTWQDGLNVWVEIGDNGPGIPPETQTRIFEPFFTTKAVGKGTGMGLDIAHRIVVERHRGEIRLQSQPGDTRFQIRLPLEQA